MLKSDTRKTKTTTKKTSTTARRKPVPAAGSRRVAAYSATMTSEKTPLPARPTSDEIARRAYELYLARGGREGSATEDWLRAERELTQKDAPSLKR